MAKSSRTNRYAVVSFDTVTHASTALKTAQKSFTRRSAKSRDLSRVDGNTVYLDTSVYCGGTSFASLKAFLMGLEGALPETHRVQ